MYQLRVKNERRLDKLLETQFPDASFNLICSWIRKKKVRVNGKHPKDPKLQLQAGDELKIFVSDDELKQAKEKSSKKPALKGLMVEKIYEDQYLMVINKPIGLLVVPSRKASERSLADVPGFSAMRVVHRLDRDTGGVMILAKTEDVEQYFFEAFKHREVEKEYLALCHGRFAKQQGTIDAPLAKLGAGRKKVVVDTKGEGREAITHYKVLKQFAGTALLQLTIETGRTHQIRVHLASIGHPICFDDQYGDREQDKKLKDFSKLRTHFLFAKKISFRHPKSGERMEFEVELDGRMEELVSILAC